MQSICKSVIQKKKTTKKRSYRAPMMLSNSKLTSYKGLVIFWREVVTRHMHKSSQTTQTVLCNAKNVRKETSAIAALGFLFKQLLALCHSCLYLYTNYFHVYPVSILQASILVLTQFFLFEIKQIQ